MNPNYQRQQDAYFTNAVLTASPLKLVVMLLDGAVAALDRAESAHKLGDAPGARKAWMKAWDIVAELRATLNDEEGGDIAGNLFALYSFALGKITEAKIQAQPEAAAEARRVLTEVRNGFTGILHGA